MNSLHFLKLGGSLITNKDKPHTPDLVSLKRIATEISEALRDNPGTRLVLGHGSGSFAHVPAKKFSTRDGVHTPAEWLGFIEVWKEARELDSLVLQALYETGIPAIAFSPSSQIITENHEIKIWDDNQISMSLERGLVPVIYGDAILDLQLGGTILSTEELFSHLATRLTPSRILIAGDEPGVWRDFPSRIEIFPEVLSRNLREIRNHTTESAHPDVTGGMTGKVAAMLDLVKKLPTLDVFIFSGTEPGNIRKALQGEKIGTRLRA